MFVLAAGGDPHRELDLELGRRRAARGRAGHARAPGGAGRGARRACRRGGGLPAVAGASTLLRAEPELAWRSLALALLADELADE